MSQGVHASEVAQMEAPSGPANPEHGLPENFGAGLLGRLLFWIAVAFSTFQIVTAFGIPLDRPLLAGVTMIHLIGAAFVGWAVWLALQRAPRASGRRRRHGACWRSSSLRADPEVSRQPAEPGGRARACRLPVPRRRRDAGQPQGPDTRCRHARMGGRNRGLRHRPLSLGLL